MARRLLIVDDALIMRRRIREIAEAAGWEVAGEAADGVQAIALFRAERPDLMTLDIVMPEMDGVEALKRVKALDPDARVIMISAVDQREKLTECIDHGAIDFIVKPFDGERLRNLFSRQLVREDGSK
jgi:two-component system chemotaxis response regulator CheY